MSGADNSLKRQIWSTIEDVSQHMDKGRKRYNGVVTEHMIEDKE